MARDRHCLYRHFDGAGELLYVGISYNPLVRFARHGEVSNWYDDVRRVDIEVFGSRREAEDAEITAIRTENPKHNKIRYSDQRVGNALRPRDKWSREDIWAHLVLKSGMEPGEVARAFKVSAGAILNAVQTAIALETNPGRPNGKIEKRPFQWQVRDLASESKEAD